MKKKAIIFGIKGISLLNNEKEIISKYKPWGIILFSRNIKSILQLKNLIKDIKIAANDKDYPILIDQEGGSVSRLNKIIDLSVFSQSFFGKLYSLKRKLFLSYYQIYISAVSSILNDVGININSVPVLDIRRRFSTSIIGTRSFSGNPSVITKIGNICIREFHKHKIATIMKHIPGHGLSKYDTHINESIIRNKKKELRDKDFKPFKECKSFFAMTAHIIYSKYDPIFTATHSKIIINEVIRKHIGFKGILISDDISMKALKYNYKINAKKALEAGCNLILHCNANIKEMKELIKIIPTIDKFTQKKTSQFYSFLR
jgi:beta-N-acetylhexosaminidase